MQDGKIAAVGPRASVQVPAAAERIDASGLTITAGFWNSHVHLVQRKWRDAAKVPRKAELAAQLREMLTRYGFTASSTRGPRGRTRGAFVSASSPADCGPGYPLDRRDSLP